MTEREELVMGALQASARPMSVMEVTAAVGESGHQNDERNRIVLNRLAFAGLVRKFYAIAAGPDRFAVEIPRLGHEGVSDPDVLDEIEAEKVWTCAAVLRAANTAWGIDMGIDADVREARAVMAEARRQVRERTPLGTHYMEGETPVAPSGDAA